MIFIVLTFIAAFLIEGLGTAVSVIGLSTLFGANPIIIALAVALDLGKLVVVSLLYKYWDKLGKVMKGYALVAALVTMTITSAGAAGYLTGEFQKAIMGTQETSLKVDVLKQQQTKYEERKKQIDNQIASLPEKTSVTQRLRLMNGFKQEQAELTAKIAEIDKQLPELQIHQIGVEAKAGPILYISRAFNVSVEEAVKYVVLMIIFVFDPLAVFLIIAGNFLLDQQRATKKKPKYDLNELMTEYKPLDGDPWKGPLPHEQLLKDEDFNVGFDKAFAAMPKQLQEQATPFDLAQLSDPEPPIFEVLEPSNPPAPAVEEPIIEPEPQQPDPPRVAEPILEVQHVDEPIREQIRLEDVRPPRSSLNDAMDTGHVEFIDTPAQHTHFYTNKT